MLLRNRKRIWSLLKFKEGSKEVEMKVEPYYSGGPKTFMTDVAGPGDDKTILHKITQTFPGRRFLATRDVFCECIGPKRMLYFDMPPNVIKFERNFGKAFNNFTVRFKGSLTSIPTNGYLLCLYTRYTTYT